MSTPLSYPLWLDIECGTRVTPEEATFLASLLLSRASASTLIFLTTFIWICLKTLPRLSFQNQSSPGERERSPLARSRGLLPRDAISRSPRSTAKRTRTSGRAPRQGASSVRLPISLAPFQLCPDFSIPYSHLRAKLHQESFEFVKQQRIMCLMLGAWFANGVPLPSSDPSAPRDPAKKQVKSWRFYRLVCLLLLCLRFRDHSH